MKNVTFPCTWQSNSESTRLHPRRQPDHLNVFPLFLSLVWDWRHHVGSLKTFSEMESNTKTYTQTQWPWWEPQSPPEPRTHTHTHTHPPTHSLSTELRRKSTGSIPQSVQRVFVISVHTLACTCACYRVCLMNPRGGSIRMGKGVWQSRCERRRGGWREKKEEDTRVSVVLKAVEIHWAANVPILENAAWQDRKEESIDLLQCTVHVQCNAHIRADMP